MVSVAILEVLSVVIVVVSSVEVLAIGRRRSHGAAGSRTVAAKPGNESSVAVGTARLISRRPIRCCWPDMAVVRVNTMASTCRFGPGAW